MQKQDTVNPFAYGVYGAKVVINDLIVETAFDYLKKGVAEIYGVPEAEIIGDDRNARFINARFAFYYGVSRFTDRNTAGYLIGRDQTTIARGITKFWQDLDFEILEPMRAKFFIDKFCEKLFYDWNFIVQNFMYYAHGDGKRLIVTALPDKNTPHRNAIEAALSAPTLLAHYKPVYKRKLAEK